MKCYFFLCVTGKGGESVDTKSYFKNLTKSVNYAVDDLLKAKYPATYNMKHLKSSISEVRMAIIIQSSLV